MGSFYGGNPERSVDMKALEQAASEVKTQAEIAKRLKIGTKKLYTVLQTNTGREAYEKGHKRYLELQGK